MSPATLLMMVVVAVSCDTLCKHSNKIAEACGTILASTALYHTLCAYKLCCAAFCSAVLCFGLDLSFLFLICYCHHLVDVIPYILRSIPYIGEM